MHNTESAYYKGVSGLVLIDRTGTFDTVDHAVLLEQLEHCIGVKGKRLCKCLILPAENNC